MKEKERMSNKNNMTLKLEKIGEKTMDKNVSSKKRSLQERGITLIALVVTIIILLILAGVTLNIALSDNGLFSKTKEAADKYKYAQSGEEEMIRQIATQMYSEYVGKAITIDNIKGKDSCLVEKEKTGHTDNQTINRENLTWKIWDFDGKNLRIIGNPTENTLTLTKVEGYNNGVWLLDHICEELYSNNATGISVRNLKRSDIQKVSTYDYTKFRQSENDDKEVTGEITGKTIKFGETKICTGTVSYPNVWKENDQNWLYDYNNENETGNDKECTIWERKVTEDGQDSGSETSDASKVQFKESYYRHEYNRNEFIDDKYFDLVFEGTEGSKGVTYWLGTRCVFFYPEKCFFCISTVGQGKLVGGTAVSDTNATDNMKRSYSLRPMITIDLETSNYELKEDKNNNSMILEPKSES